MKKGQIVGLFLFGILQVLNGYAQQVTKAEATQAAINTIRYEYNGSNNNLVDTVFTKISRNDTILYEVVFDNGDVVLLSGNKACVPILGIILHDTAYTNGVSSVTDTCSILARGNEIPEGLLDFLDDYEQQITFCFNNSVTGFYQRLWQQLQTYDSNFLRNGSEVGPYISTRWGQSESNDKWPWDRDPYAYNALVSEYGQNCDKCAAGCVAVALAQIMKVWNYPAENPQQCIDFSWNNMPNMLILQNNSNYNVEKNAVAYLIRDCGQSSKMHYCTNGRTCGSGSIIDSACYAYKMYGYSDVIPLQRSECPNWKSLIINELDNERPIEYFGKNGLGYGGHSFVCDGYKERTLLGGYKFHFNWGWNGKHNGWFVLDDLTPGNHIYSFYHKAIMNIYPTGCFLNIIMECGKFFSNGMVEEIAVTDSFQNNGYGFIISNNADIRIHAGQEILLSNGFCAEAGSNFSASISQCNTSTNLVLDNFDETNTNTTSPEYLSEPKSLQQPASLADDATLKVYPNPTDNLFHVELSGADIKSIVLYDLRGRVVETLHATSLQGGTATVNVRDVLAGVYVLRVTDTEGRSYARKVTIR